MQTIGTKCSGSHISSALPHSQIFRTVIDIVLKSSLGFSMKSSRRCRVSVQCLPRCYTGHPPTVPLQELRALVTPGELTQTCPELLKLSLHEVTLCSYNFDEIVIQSPREQFHRQKCLLSLTCSFHPPLKAVATNHLLVLCFLEWHALRVQFTTWPSQLGFSHLALSFRAFLCLFMARSFFYFYRCIMLHSTVTKICLNQALGEQAFKVILSYVWNLRPASATQDYASKTQAKPSSGAE